MNKVYKLLKILVLLRKRKIVKSSILTKELEVTSRQLSRYKEDLEKAGILIKSSTGKYGGYLLESRSIFKAKSTNEELEILIKDVSSSVIKIKDAIKLVKEMQKTKPVPKEIIIEAPKKEIKFVEKTEEVEFLDEVVLIVKEEELSSSSFSSKFRLIEKNNDLVTIGVKYVNKKLLIKEILSLGAKCMVVKPIKLAREIECEVIEMNKLFV